VAALRVEVVEDPERLGVRAASRIAAAVRARPSLLLCAASGSTPTATYERLAAKARRAPGAFARLRVLKLDEWLGLPADHPATCEADLRAHLVGPLGVTADRYLAFRADRDPERECARVRRALQRWGRIDVCVLGLGRNGHVGMNEPAPALRAGPHVARLRPTTRAHPMLRGLARRPTHGLTLGMADILRSWSVLLLVSGRHKRGPLRRLLEGPVTTAFPASLLALHPDATVICDREAANG
jgi:galactosamine-6-phosphate isomerase